MANASYAHLKYFRRCIKLFLTIGTSIFTQNDLLF